MVQSFVGNVSVRLRGLIPCFVGGQAMGKTAESLEVAAMRAKLFAILPHDRSWLASIFSLRKSDGKTVPVFPGKTVTHFSWTCFKRKPG
ncbi:hypothetical protein [Brucella endophytica]|uniref:hypothetical protein n=1 Tax=Brucella endophytica TaxID=1963359 RepID=UPI00166A0331|nr:hypothetical protein [Brucella endophytica]